MKYVPGIKVKPTWTWCVPAAPTVMGLERINSVPVLPVAIAPPAEETRTWKFTKPFETTVIESKVIGFNTENHIPLVKLPKPPVKVAGGPKLIAFA